MTQRSNNVAYIWQQSATCYPVVGWDRYFTNEVDREFGSLQGAVAWCEGNLGVVMWCEVPASQWVRAAHWRGYRIESDQHPNRVHDPHERRSIT